MAVRISCGVGFPKWNPKGKSGSFNAFEPMDILHPEENGGSKADFAEQSA